MDQEKMDAVMQRVLALTEEQREELDPICEAIDRYADGLGLGARFVPNRVIALACIELYLEWSRIS